MHPKINSLHPIFIGKAQTLYQALIEAYQAGRTKTLFEPFEGVRSPDRQNQVFAAGTSKARAWQSAHQYGLALDFAARKITGDARYIWSWDAAHDWTFLKTEAERHGLSVPIIWDKGHVEHPIWRNWKTWMSA